MFLSVAILTTLPLALSIVATPTGIRNHRITLPVAKRINNNGGGTNLVAHDQARATVSKGRGAAPQSDNLDRRQSVDVINGAIAYIATVTIGDPSNTFYLIVDTGSSNTWVGANTPYTPTSPSQDTGQPVSVGYGSGSFSGEQWLDTIQLSLDNGPVIYNQGIGVASSSSGFSGVVDGILGLGPGILTEGSLLEEPFTEVATVTENLYAQGTITEEVVGVFFVPISESAVNGELTFGGVDPTKYTGSLTYTPLTNTPPAAYYWGINQSITYGTTTILAETAGIVDTGTTLILLATDAYSAYLSATGAKLDSTTSMLMFTSDQYNSLENLNFNIDSVTYVLTPNGQIWPRALNTYFGGTSGAIYGVINDLGSPSGQGLDFIIGLTFLERFYSVFDASNNQVGFATTTYTDATTN